MVYCMLALIVLFTIGKNFSTTGFYITQDLFKRDVGISDQQLSLLFVCGYISSFPAKLIAGYLADVSGSSGLILFCMAGFFIGTLALSFVQSGSLAIYIAIPIWSFTTFFSQGVFRVVSKTMAADWIPGSHLGRLMSIVTLAPNLGDALVRLVLAPFLELGWQTVLRISTFLILLTCMPFAVVASRTSAPEALPDLEVPLMKEQCRENSSSSESSSKKAKQSEKKKPKKSFKQTLHLLKNPDIWVLCCLSCLMFATRTLFLVDSTNLLGEIRCRHAGVEIEQATSPPGLAPETTAAPMSLQDMDLRDEAAQKAATVVFMTSTSSGPPVVDVKPASDPKKECLHSPGTLRAITAASSIYTLVGAASTFVVGVMKDASPTKHRAVCLVPFVAVLLVLSVVQIYFGDTMGFEWTVARLALTGFCLFGPYKIISVFAVDIGGKEFKGTATGLVGASESVGAIFILLAKGWAGDDWRLMFCIITSITTVSFFLCIKLWTRDIMAHREVSAEWSLGKSTLLLQA